MPCHRLRRWHGIEPARELGCISRARLSPATPLRHPPGPPRWHWRVGRATQRPDRRMQVGGGVGGRWPAPSRPLQWTATRPPSPSYVSGTLIRGRRARPAHLGRWSHTTLIILISPAEHGREQATPLACPASEWLDIQGRHHTPPPLTWPAKVRLDTTTCGPYRAALYGHIAAITRHL